MIGQGVFSWQELLDSRTEKRPLIAGIVNATDDSFSDGKGYIDPSERADFALKLLEEGADIIDLGGESTRPGAKEIPPPEEWQRIAPVLKKLLAQQPGAIVSIDTRHSYTARLALENGAKIINDVSGLEFDKQLGNVIAEYHAGAILTHSTAEPALMQQEEFLIDYDVINIVKSALAGILHNAESCGIPLQQIMLDVGIGFGKSRPANYSLLKSAKAFEKNFNLPFCWGVSRKSLLKSEPDSLDKRIAGSLVLAVKLSEQNVSLLRVHDVAQTLAALKTAQELEAAL